MITLLQRVSEASVSVAGTEVSSIERGYLLLVGIEKEDTEKDLNYSAAKILGLRVFEDDQGRMNRSLADVNGEILAVSQFTLAGSVRKGRRPSFDNAMEPEKANLLFEKFVSMLEDGCPSVKRGCFGEHMDVRLMNDGPVTFIVDSQKRL